MTEPRADALFPVISIATMLGWSDEILARRQKLVADIINMQGDWALLERDIAALKTPAALPPTEPE